MAPAAAIACFVAASALRARSPKLAATVDRTELLSLHSCCTRVGRLLVVAMASSGWVPAVAAAAAVAAGSGVSSRVSLKPWALMQARFGARLLLSSRFKAGKEAGFRKSAQLKGLAVQGLRHCWDRPRSE